MKSIWSKTATFLITAGILLLAINIAGQLVGNACFYQPKPHKEYIKYSPSDDLRRKPDESEQDFIMRMNHYVYTRTNHWFMGLNDDTHTDPSYISSLSVPFIYNPLIYARQLFFFLKSKDFRLEFQNARSALLRGYGFCSQRALIVTDILHDNNIDADTISINGHVIATAKITDEGTQKDFVLDPDYDVAIPFSLEYTQNNTNILNKYYNDKNTEVIIGIYEKKFRKKYGIRFSKRKELFFVWLQWLIPAALICLGMCIRWRCRRE